MPNPFDQFDAPSPRVLVPAPPKEPSKPKTTYRVMTPQEKAQFGLDPSGDYQMSSEGQVSAITQPRNQNNKISANVRADAIAGYTSAQQLRKLATDLRAQNKSGPGSTKGVAGLQDYLPTPSNRAFDATSDAARGIIKNALGFTGGENNTAIETRINIGPYLPQAGDYDNVINDKIARLDDLANRAEQRAVAVLGGVPDANGNVKPAPAATPLNAPPPPVGGQAVLDGNAGGNLTSDAGYQRDPALSGARQKYLAMLASGESPDKIIGFLKDAGVPIDMGLVKSINDQAAFHRKNPNVPLGKYDTDMLDMRWHPGSNVIGKMGDSSLGAATVAAGNAMTGGLADELVGATGGNQAQAQLAKDVLRQRFPGASLGGDIAGSALAMGGGNAALRFLGGRLAPLATRAGGIGGDALYGAAFGAGENNDNRLTGALAGGAAAGAGNLLGRGLVSGAGRMVSGVRNADVGYLANRDVRMTPGQLVGQSGVLGKGVRLMEDAFESIPGVGAAIRTRKGEGVRDFNREAFKDALAPIGEQVQGTIGQDAIGEAQDLVSDSYGSALGDMTIRADLPFAQQAVKAAHMGQSVPTMGDQFDYIVRNKLGPLFLSNRRLDGTGFQAALQTTKKASRDFSKQGAMGSEAADFMGDMTRAFTGLAERQAPETMPALNAANAANRNVSVLGDAVNSGLNTGGIFTPAQLGRASLANTKKYGGARAAARGDIPFADLQSAGQNVLPNQMPNSGTTDRALANLVLPTALGGAAVGSDYFNLPTPVTATLGGLGVAYTGKGNNVLQTLLTSRSPQARKLGEEIIRKARLGGMFGAGASIPLLTSQ